MAEQWRRNAWVLWIVVALHGLAWTAIVPYLPVFLDQDLHVQGAKAWAGVLTSVFALCGAIFGPIWGAIGDRHGRLPTLVRSGLVMAVGYALMIVARGPWELLGIRILGGVFSGFGAISLAIVAVNTPREHTGWALSLQQTAFPAGALLGPAIGGVIYDLLGIRWAMGLSTILVLAGTSLAALLVREERVAPVKARGAPRQSLAADLKAAATHPGLLAVLLITVLGRGSIGTVEPVFVPFVKQLAGPGAPNWLGGAIFSLGGVALVLAVGRWARLSERIGHVRTLSYGLAGAAVFFCLQGLSRTPLELAAFRLSGGLMEAAVVPGVIALLGTTVPLHLRGRALGLNLSAHHLGQVAGPLIGGFVGTYAGSRYVFFVAASAMAFGYFWTRRSFGRRPGEGEAA